MLLPYFVLGIGYLLGWRFHRSRLAFIILILVLADRALYYFGPGGLVSTGYEQVIYYSIAVLLPINMALFYLVRERGVLNPAGLFRLLFILAQPLTVYFLLRDTPGIFDYLDHQLVNFPFLDTMPVPQPVLFLYAGIALIFFIGSLSSNKPVVRGFFWSLLALAAALYSVGNGADTTIYFSAAGLIIILSVLETAYAMAYYDELTGLPARRSLNTTMQALGRRYTIAMLDIDFFKKFNDRYGHDVGDQVLCMVASHIRKVGGGENLFATEAKSSRSSFPENQRMMWLCTWKTCASPLPMRSSGCAEKTGRKGPPRKEKKGKTQIMFLSLSVSGRPNRVAISPNRLRL